jgi:hypothetical protein
MSHLSPPWTEEQVANLNFWQTCGFVHPYTCECGNNLFATRDGFACAFCGYKQDWCHADTANRRPVNPFDAFKL